MANGFNVVKYINEHTNDEGVCALNYDKEFFNYLCELNPDEATDDEIAALGRVDEIDWAGCGISELPQSMWLLESLKSLNIGAKRQGYNLLQNHITNIEVLNNLTNLQSLNLSYNKITDIDVLSNLINLQSLNLWNNQIADIEVLGNLTNLQSLDLSDTKITHIEVLSKLTNLQKLDLSGNEITNIEVLGRLTNLQTLDLYGNKITNIEVLCNLTNLQSLNLWNNQIADIEVLGNLTNLQSLNLSGNKITDIEALSELTNLESLNLWNNQIADIEVLHNLTKLQELKLWGNEITDIGSLSGLSALQTLDLTNNQITTIDENTFNGLNNLTKLDLNHNNLASLSLKNLPALTSLNAMDNNIDELTLQGLPSLEELVLSENQISDMSAFAELEKLKSLELRHNRISEIKGLEKLRSLEELWLYDNQITELSGLDGLTGLKRLYLSNNRIKELKGMDNLEILEKLNIGENEITAIKGLDRLKNLKSLFLISNKIQKIEGLEKLTDLEELYLGENQIEKIENISHLTKLETLDLDSNPFRELPELPTLTNLKHVYLQNLTIKGLPRSLFDLNLTYSIGEDKNNTSANVIHLHGTTLTQQPISLFVTNKRKLIKNYYDAEKEIIKEAKVMFLGDGGAGKTYTIKRLKNYGIQSDEYHTQETDTIEISQFDTGDDITLKLWDFGGQEYMHSMHRCFLTARSVYVVVLSGRMGNLTNRAIYWLENINSFAKNSPVILAVNCWENDSNPGVDYEMLSKRYPNLKGEIVYSAKCSAQEKFNELTKAIIKQAKELDGYGMEMPIVWTSIMDTITERFKTESMITKADYIQICKDADKTGIITDDIRVWLLDWFNDLGLCFSNHRESPANMSKTEDNAPDNDDGKDNTSNGKPKERENYNLLNPSWLFRGIYSIIKTNEERAKEDEEFEIIDGVIKKTSIKKSIGLSANDNYHQYEDYIDDLLAIMRNFVLSYQLSEKEEFIAALCPVKMPTSFTCDNRQFKKQLQFEFRYTYLPDSVVQRLMVFGKAELGYSVENPWKSGLELIHGDLIALIHKDEIKPYLTVTIFAKSEIMNTGNSVFGFFKTLREQIDRINTQLNISANGYIIKELVTNDNGNTINSGFSVDGLLDALSKNKDIVTYLDNGVYEEYKIKDLLGMAFSEDDIKKMKENKQMENEKGLPNSGTVYNITNNITNSKDVKIAGHDIITDSYNQEQTVTNIQNEIDKIIKLLNNNSGKITGDDINNAAKKIISGNVDEDTGDKACDVLAEPDNEKKQSKFKELLGWAKEQVTDPDKAKKWLGVVTAVGSIIAKAVGA